MRSESGWSSFAEREVKCIVDWLLRMVYEESLVSDIGRACLMEREREMPERTTVCIREESTKKR